jgi:hypothetical protein
MMSGMDRPEPEPSRRASFEDFETPTPTPVSRGGRTGILITAAVVLAVSGLLNLLFILLFRPEGGTVALYVVFGVLSLVAAAAVIVRHPVGRVLGVAIAAAGIILAVTRASDDAVAALLSIALNAFVLYALGVSGPSFRRG